MRFGIEDLLEINMAEQTAAESNVNFITRQEYVTLTNYVILLIFVLSYLLNFLDPA